MKIFTLIFLVSVFLMPVSSFAIQDSRELAVDSRIRTFVYDPNEVYVFTGHYRYQSSIELSPSETISTVSIGDSVAWQIVSRGNRLFLKPIEQDATTNMTIVTDKRIYHFELYAEEAEDIRDENLVFSVRFSYPNSEGMGNSLKRFGHINLPDIINEPEKFNFNYTITGSGRIAPIKIFDDGEFTYFEFRNKNTDVPAFFRVNMKGEESIVNYRVSGPYIVVERVTSQFTLRYGTEITCVFNEAMPNLPLQ